jgi:hypothetical protein
MVMAMSVPRCWPRPNLSDKERSELLGDSGNVPTHHGYLSLKILHTSAEGISFGSHLLIAGVKRLCVAEMD